MKVMKEKYIYRLLLKLFFAVFCAFTLYSCSEKDYGNANLNGVPSITDYKDLVSLTVNQDSNLVTLKLNSKEVMPVWVFEDGTTNTTNNYQMTTRLAGTYSVEVKVANKNGISDGSVVLTYTINNTLVDKTLITYLCGGLENSTKKWVWNSKVDGHFGCGENYLNPAGWWSCPANGKAAWGMYDDIFTFGYSGTGISGTYTYDPGTGGTIYVNTGCTFSPFNTYNTNDGNDYMAKVNVQNTSWTFEYEGNNLFLTFPAGTMMGYIPNVETYNSPKFKVISITDNKLTMACYNGSIAWKYEFIPKDLFDSGADAELDGSQYASAIKGSWMWNETVDGHFGCGSDHSNPTGWWSCPAEGKAGFGLYDDILTFDGNGNYTYDPGIGGTIYCNWGTYTFMDPNKEYYSGDGSTDFQMPVSKQNSTYSIVQNGTDYYLQFAPKTFVSYLPSEEVYDNPKYLITKMTSSLIEFVSLGTGISWKYQFIKK